MKTTSLLSPSLFQQSLLLLSLATDLLPVHGDSIVFSQYAGAATVTAAFSGTSASLQSAYFTECTNYLHGLPPLTAIPSSLSVILEQEAADGVCQFCSSLDLSRVNSCCAQPTSSDCFKQFVAQGTAALPAATAPATVPATLTAMAGTPGATKASRGNRVDASLLGPVLMAIGFLRWAL